MAKINIIDETETETTREGTGEWDGDDTATSHYIRGFEVVDPSEKYSDFEVNFNIDQDTYYFLYAIYSTGDSFSHHEGKIEYIGLYKTFADAEVNQERIQAHYEDPETHKNWDKMFTVKLISPSGEEYSCHVPWNGYFESLTEVRIEPIMRMSKSARKKYR